jgi:hypothetical protein
MSLAPTNPTSPLAAWLIRLLFVCLLAFASEVWLWTLPQPPTLERGALALFGYFLISSLLLDLAVRFHARSLFSVLLLGGLAAIAHALIINPAHAFADLPMTLFTRIMGAHTLINALMFMLLVRLLQGDSTRVDVVVALALGIIGGGWAHGSPTLNSAAPTSPETIALVYAIALAVIVALLTLVRRAAPAMPDLRLPFQLRAFVLMLLALLAIQHLSQGVYSWLVLAVMLVLFVFCGLIVWYEKRAKSPPLLAPDQPVRVTPSAILRLIAALVAGLCLGYLIARGAGITDTIAIIAALFTAFGFVWLPAISLSLGAREFRKLIRTTPL